MKVHNIYLRAFFKEEGLEDGKKIFNFLLPEDISIIEEKLEPESEGGVFNEPLFALKAVVSKQGEINDFIKKILLGLDDADLQELKDTLDSRIDDDCNLYIRVGKNKLLEGKIALHSRDPVHVRIKLACFPKKKQNALKIALELLENK
jgi:RNA binding exosome subunit